MVIDIEKKNLVLIFINSSIEIMIDYTLTEEDIMYCRKAIEDYDDDGNGQIGIFDL